jgi:hypothetical protein
VGHDLRDQIIDHAHGVGLVAHEADD